MGIRSLDIVATFPDREYRFLSGERLVQFEEDFFEPPKGDDDCLGRLGLLERPLTASPEQADQLDPRDVPVWLPGSMGPQGVKFEDAASLEVEIAVTQDGHSAAEPAVRRVLGEDCVRVVIAAVSSPPQAWSSSEVLALGPPLENAGVVDFRLVTLLEGIRFCLHHLYAIRTSRWLLKFLTGPYDPQGKALDLDFRALPGSRVRHSARTPIACEDASSRLARTIQDVLRHHEYANNVLTSELERWEKEFFECVVGTSGSLEKLQELQARLARLRGIVSCLQTAEKTMNRRGQNQPAFPPEVKEEVRDRCHELSAELLEQRRDLRDSYLLVAGAAADEAAKSSKAAERSARRLNLGLVLVTALVLVPGLVISLYGADVRGQPGLGTNRGLTYVGLFSLAGAGITLAILALLYFRGRDRRE